LRTTEVARGLITFLVAFATVAIAVILALYAVVNGAKEGEAKERFALGKEVLTTLIGVLGTIVGFYFGSSTGSQVQEDRKLLKITPPVVQIAPVSLSNERPKKGEAVSVASFVYGGKPPYHYTLSFLPANVVPAISRTTADGTIKEDIKLGDAIAADTELTLQIEVKDKEGHSATLADKTRKLIVTE
jgi:hypothetical protein